MSPSLRMTTYNTAIQVAPGDSEDYFALDFEERARAIAEQILADDPDVVILNEVHQNASKDVFVEELQGRYPSFISFLDGPWYNRLNDSGLMLFSKFLFTDPDGFIVNNNRVDVANQGAPAFVNFKTFTGDGDDWWANKGAAMVRILNECNGNSPFSVAFTHMQASAADASDGSFGDEVVERQQQLETIREMIETHVAAGSRRIEPIFVVGDLNINGNLHDDSIRNMVVSNNAGTVELPHTEWRWAFDSTNPADPLNDQHGGFYACRGRQCTYDPTVSPPAGTFLTDGWGFETSPDDPGQTASTELVGGALSFPNPGQGARFDYILHNRAKAPDSGAPGRDNLCLQHMTRGFAPLRGEGIGGDLSDHLPLTADFNRAFSRCSPHPRAVDRVNPSLGPAEVDFVIDDPSDAAFQDVSFSGLIRFPGSVQWYVIDQAYPYEITLSGANVGYRVYQASNLSNPKPPFDGQCEEDDGLPEGSQPNYSCKFTMYEPPYFVQVFASVTSADSESAPDRTRAMVPYTIGFHRFDCSSIEEACMLEPAVEAGPFIWPQGPLNPAATPPDDQTMFFEFRSELARGGLAPEVTFLLDHDFPLPVGNQPDVLSMSLVDENGLLVCAPADCPSGDGLDSQSPAAPAWNTDSDGDSRPDRLATAREATLPGDGTWPAKYYLKVRRDDAFQAEKKNVWVTFETDLTYFRPLELYCAIERTDVGDDDLEARFLYDGVRIHENLGPSWDDGRKIEQAGTTGVWWTELPWAMDGAYVLGTTPDMFEDVMDGDDYPFETIGPDKIEPVDRSTRALSDNPLQDVLVWSDEPDQDDAEYWYELTFQRTHDRPPCRKLDSGFSGDCVAPRFCEDGACKLP